MSDIALQTSGLGVKYGNFHALADVDLKIRRNSVHSIIGPNGAGKTTLFHALTGRVRASSGRIELDGHVNASSTAYIGNWSGSFGTGTFALQK